MDFLIMVKLKLIKKVVLVSMVVVAIKLALVAMLKARLTVKTTCAANLPLSQGLYSA